MMHPKGQAFGGQHMKKTQQMGVWGIPAMSQLDHMRVFFF